MLIQNNTFKVDLGIAAGWYRWQQEHFIPEVMKTGLFTEYRCYELLDQDPRDGKTYVIQFWASDKNLHDAFLLEFDEQLQRMAIQRWGDRVVGFRTLLESL